MSTHTNGGFLDVVLDGPPGPDGGRFVEVEDANGRSVDVGEWRRREDGLWALRIRGGAAGAPIVCLCGSTRFARQFVEQNERLTLAGNIVLSVGSFGHLRAEPYTEGQKAALDALHLRKIDLADRVLVLNVGGYIGESTRREVEYAERAGKPVDYLEPLP